jgi:hypothetical protein
MRTDLPDWLLPRKSRVTPIISRENLVFNRKGKHVRVRHKGIVYDTINDCAIAIGRSPYYVSPRAHAGVDGFEILS